MEQNEVSRDKPASSIRDTVLHKQLLTRRERIQAALPNLRNDEKMLMLLHEVDAALERMDAGTFGICETCHEEIENDRLLSDPLCRNCLDHLSAAEQRALERDLDLAFQIQGGLLPKPGLAPKGWTIAYHYQPVGPVSGDYCDVIVLEDGTGLFLVGDVSGKGIAASILMAHLHAIFRSLNTPVKQVHELVANANRVFCEGTMSEFFATLVCGRLGSNGEVEICNAGHCLPLHIHRESVSPFESTGLPLGLFSDSEYFSRKEKLEAGDSLVLYSDGLSETLNIEGEQYGDERLSVALRQRSELQPKELLAALLEDLKNYHAGVPATDDLTIMVIRRDL